MQNRVSERLRALIYDSYYDDYRGVVCQFRVVDGEVRLRDSIRLMNTGREYQIDEIGVLSPGQTKVLCIHVLFHNT